MGFIPKKKDKDTVELMAAMRTEVIVRGALGGGRLCGIILQYLVSPSS
jgi:hypothetical protein